MSQLDPHELEALLPGETASFPSPIPTRFLPTDEFLPGPQTQSGKRVEARVNAPESGLARGAYSDAQNRVAGA